MIANVAEGFYWNMKEDRISATLWYSPLQLGSSSCPSGSGRVPVSVGRMVGCPTHPLNMSRESTLTHTEHVQIRFLHYLQAFRLWINSKHQKTYRLLFARLQQRCSLRSSMVGMRDYWSVFRVNKRSNFRGECLLIRARASTKSGWWAGSGPGSVCSPVSPPGSPAGFVPEPAGEIWRAPAQLELGLNEQNSFQWRLVHAVCAWTSASASEEWTFCKAESWRSSHQFWFGHPQNQSLTGESERQEMHRELLRATGLSPQVPGTGQLSAGRWRCRLGRSVSGLHQHLQLSPCLLLQCSEGSGLSAQVSQPSPLCAGSPPVWKHQYEFMESAAGSSILSYLSHFNLYALKNQIFF